MEFNIFSNFFRRTKSPLELLRLLHFLYHDKRINFLPDECVDKLRGNLPGQSLRIERSFGNTNVFLYDDRMLRFVRVNERLLEAVPQEGKSHEMIRKIVDAHICALEVGIWSSAADIDKEFEQTLSNLVCLLAESGALAICDLSKEIIIPLTDYCLKEIESVGVTALLSQGAPENNLRWLSVQDAQFASAKERAQTRINEFVQLLSNPQQDYCYSAKASFADGEIIEHMWFSVLRIEGSVLFGILANVPMNLTNLSLDDQVRVELSTVEDWMVWTGEEVIAGGFLNNPDQ